MTSGPTRVAPRGAGAGGFVTLQFVTASALSLVLFAGVANLLVYQYGHGVVRAALDEGVRAGSRASDPAAECETRATAVIGDLLGGPMGRGVALRCADDPARVHAAADVTFHGWAPMVPDWSFTAKAFSARKGRR